MLLGSFYEDGSISAGASTCYFVLVAARKQECLPRIAIADLSN